MSLLNVKHQRKYEIQILNKGFKTIKKFKNEIKLHRRQNLKRKMYFLETIFLEAF